MVRRVSQQLDQGVEPEERDAPVQDDRDEDLELEADDADSEDEEEDDDESPEGVEDDELPVGDEPVDEPVRQARRPGRRGDRQMGDLRERARQLEHELQLERAARQQQMQPRGESEAVRRARLAAMSDQERTEYLINEVRAETQQQRELDRFNAADAADRARFEGIAQSNARYKKYAGEVERRLELARRAGQNVPRETILTYILGERMRAGLDSPQVKRQKAAAKDRVAREKAALPRTRGERGSSRSETDRAARERRLENVQI